MILVVGDAIVDRYIIGTRVPSTEGDVICIKHRKEIILPGGAANVAKNLVDLDQDVNLVCLGSKIPEYNSRLINSLQLDIPNKCWVDMVLLPGYSISTKTRFYAGDSYILRYDDDPTEYPTDAALNKYYERVQQALGYQPSCIVVSDYRNGAVTKTLLDMCINSGIKVIGNLKPETIKLGINGLHILTMNNAEFDKLVYPYIPGRVCQYLDIDYMFITRGINGINVSDRYIDNHIPATLVRVVDTIGAGDAVVASIAKDIAANNTDILSTVAKNAANFASSKISARRFMA